MSFIRYSGLNETMNTYVRNAGKKQTLNFIGLKTSKYVFLHKISSNKMVFKNGHHIVMDDENIQTLYTNNILNIEIIMDDKNDFYFDVYYEEK